MFASKVIFDALSCGEVRGYNDKLVEVTYFGGKEGIPEFSGEVKYRVEEFHESGVPDFKSLRLTSLAKALSVN